MAVDPPSVAEPVDPKDPDPVNHPDLPGESGLPYLPSAGDPSVTVSDLTIVTIDQEFGDGDEGTRPPDPKKPVLTPRDILAQPEPQVDTTGMSPAEAKAAKLAEQARMQLRNDGKQLYRVADSSDFGGLPMRVRVDLAATAFRGNLSEFWSYSKASIRNRVESSGDKARLKTFDANFADGMLVAALDTWSLQRRVSPLDDNLLAVAQRSVLDELTALHTMVGQQYNAIDAALVEPFLQLVLDGVAREVARQASQALSPGVVDYGTAYGGVAYATRLAAPSEAVADIARGFVAGATDPDPSKGAARNLFTGWIKSSLESSGAKTSSTGLQSAARDWSAEVRKFQPGGDPTALATASATLFNSLDAARKAVTSATLDVGTRRSAERTFDGLAVAVAERLEGIAAKSGIAGQAKLVPIAKQLRAAVTPPVDATDPLSKFWSRAKTAGTRKLPTAESKALTAWFGDGLSGSLDGWSKEIAKVPNHDHDTLLKQSWAVSSTLDRYREGINKIVTDPDAKAALLDGIEALAQKVSSTLQRDTVVLGSRL